MRLDDGPELIVPFLDRSLGTRVVVEIRADDILLARQPLGGLSARNQIAGIVERIIPHGPDAEAVVRTGGLTWIVSLVVAGRRAARARAGHFDPFDHQGAKLPCPSRRIHIPDYMTASSFLH